MKQTKVNQLVALARAEIQRQYHRRSQEIEKSYQNVADEITTELNKVVDKFRKKYKNKFSIARDCQYAHYGIHSNEGDALRKWHNDATAKLNDFERDLVLSDDADAKKAFEDFLKSIQ